MNLTLRLGSLISAAHLPHGLCRTPLNFRWAVHAKERERDIYWCESVVVVVCSGVVVFISGCWCYVNNGSGDCADFGSLFCGVCAVILLAAVVLAEVVVLWI